ncbi:hypothetical protein GCM10023238_06130 [Streptomyces heliomycini]
MSERKPHPMQLIGRAVALIGPVITAWKDRRRSVSSHQDTYAMQEIVNAILYQGPTGCQWAYLPPKSATYYYSPPARRRTDQSSRAPALPVRKRAAIRGPT